MFNRKFSSNIRRRKRMIKSTIILLVVFLSIGYSAFSSNLVVDGTLMISEYEDPQNPTLYGVLKKAAKKGYAQEYTGEHHDSFTEESTKKIYHWYAANSAESAQILDRWNVIFGGFCWQMYRTTDTGGVKMIYNGIPDGGKCNSSGLNQQIGKSKFNSYSNSVAYEGYMYNTVYNVNTKSTSVQDVLDSLSMNYSSTYYFGTGVTYDENTGQYTLTDTIQDTWRNIYDSSSGLYTCTSASTATCASAFYIVGSTSTHAYGHQLYNGHFLDTYDTNIVLGTGYNENNGTYTLDNTTVISQSEFMSNRDLYKNYYICDNYEATCTDLRYITSISESSYYYVPGLANYIYANDFTYDSTTNKYTLNNDRIQILGVKDTDFNSLKTHHYTCLNQTGECETLSYVYFATKNENNRKPYIYYINLENGKNIETAINEMLYDDEVNTTNSIIKTYLDTWYQNNLTGYTSELEDTIFCYNRDTSELNGWDPDGGNMGVAMIFNYSSLECAKDTDKFSLSNNKAKLTYPIGLITLEEIYMTAASGAAHFKTGESYWIGSPNFFVSNNALVYYVPNSGSYILNDNANSSYGVRPVISLKPGAEYKAGNGSKESPYYVGEVYNITSSSNLVPKQSPPDYTVTLGNDDYAVTSFKLDGALINGDSFVMPHHDVTVTDVQSVQAYYTITNTDSTINVPDRGKYNSTIELTSDNYRVDSFKVNGSLITGNSFVMPAQNVTITDIQKTPQVTIESEHNPYANSINNVTYYENTFAGATSLTVELTYQTESTSYDWIYLYDDANSTTPFNNKKYGGSTLKTETLTIPSNYLKIVFKTDGSGNNFYGFKAVITPNYD